MDICYFLAEILLLNNFKDIYGTPGKLFFSSFDTLLPENYLDYCSFRCGSLLIR